MIFNLSGHKYNIGLPKLQSQTGITYISLSERLRKNVEFTKSELPNILKPPSGKYK